jgi:polar amino acid transport system permease protein
VVTSPGWDSVQEIFFNGEVFAEYFPGILDAFWLDIRVFIVAEIAVLMLGLLVALTRVTKSPALFPLRLLATVYTDLFRGIPTILLIYLIGFGVPALVVTSDEGNGLGWLEPIASQPVLLGGIGLTLSYAAYVAEVYRAGLRSVHRWQREAGLAVGLTEQQTMRHVVLPQAVRNVGPPLLNDFIALQKDVALLAILGVSTEAFARAQIDASTIFNYTPLIAAALLYLCITIPMARLLDWWERKREA